MSFIEQNKQAYNTISGHFSRTRQWVWEDLKPLVRYIKDGDHILDLGCGNGRVYQLFKDFQVSYTGVDFSEGQIEEAKKMFPEADFRLGEMSTIPLGDKTVDCIFCIATFHHLPDIESRRTALKEMSRVLKDGGRLIMTNWNLDSEWAAKKVREGKWEKAGERDFIIPWRDQDGAVLANRYYYGFQMDELQNLLEHAGLMVEKQSFSDTPWSDDKNGQNIITVAKKK